MVAGGAVKADFGRAGGAGAKFWASAEVAVSKTTAATTSARGMLYYSVMSRLGFTLTAVLLGLAAVAHAAPEAPGFKVTTLDGRTLDSRELLGKKVIVLRFQASYCKPCVKESRSLNQVADRYRGREVEVIAVHVQDTANDVRRFMKTNKVTYPVVLDPKLLLGNRFGFKGTPYTVIIDRKGEMVARSHGEGVPNRLPKILDGLLKTNPASQSPPRDSAATARAMSPRRSRHHA
jgi:peroxiredoxin